MKKKIIKKVAILSLVICLGFAMLVLPTSCGEQENKAIIILPGIMGSNIIDAESGEPIWAPLPPGVKMFELDIKKDISTILKTPAVQKILFFDKPGGAYEWLDKMLVDPKTGKSKHHMSAQVIDDEGNVKYPQCATYGTLEYYEKTYHYLEDNFGDEYDVRMFEYDWRLDNMTSAIALENFINDHGYTSVTFVAHSMGGILASTYLARSEENRAKVDKFIPLGTPFFGSHKAVRVVDDPMSLVGSDMDDVLNTVKGAVDAVNKKGSFDTFLNKFISFARNLPTLYQLIPYEDMCKAYTECDALNGLGIVSVDGQPIANYDEFMSFLNNKGYTNKNFVKQMIDWQREQYVKQGDEWIHVSKLVDTRYIVGNNLPTELCVNFNAQGKQTGCTLSNLGDGTVPLYSATCGLDVTDSRVYQFEGISHGDLSYDDKCLDKIAELIRE